MFEISFFFFFSRTLYCIYTVVLMLWLTGVYLSIIFLWKDSKMNYVSAIRIQIILLIDFVIDCLSGIKWICCIVCSITRISTCCILKCVFLGCGPGILWCNGYWWNMMVPIESWTQIILEHEMPFHKQHYLRLNQPLVCGKGREGGGVWGDGCGGKEQEKWVSVKKEKTWWREREWHTRDPMLYHYGLRNVSEKMTECLREGKWNTDTLEWREVKESDWDWWLKYKPIWKKRWMVESWWMNMERKNDESFVVGCSVRCEKLKNSLKN